MGRDEGTLKKDLAVTLSRFSKEGLGGRCREGGGTEGLRAARSHQPISPVANSRRSTLLRPSSLQAPSRACSEPDTEA